MIAFNFVLIASYFLTANSEAREFPFKKKVDPAALQQQLKRAGFSVHHISCSGDNCKIYMPESEKKNPAKIVSSYVYEDLATIREARVKTARALHEKWKNGALTPGEKDEFLKILNSLLFPD